MALETLYGVHPVTEALRSKRRRIHQVWLSTKRSGDAAELIEKLAKIREVPVSRAGADVFKDLDAGHQGVAARVSALATVSLEEILHKATATGGVILAFDGIEDPRNLGALVRTALCTGVAGVILTKDRSAQPSPLVSKASAGALEHVLIARETNLARSLDQIKKAGLWVFGLDGDSKDTIWSADLSVPLCLCVGGEGKGLRRLVRQRCDMLVAIPQSGPVGSLNASVAGALALYEALRQRKAKQD